jgi:predicted nucleic acid-binding protein
VIAADSSSLIEFLVGGSGPDIGLIEQAIGSGVLVLAPPVIAELRAGAVQEEAVDALLGDAPMLALVDGFWERAGRNRRLLLTKRLRARFADALIAQCCIDADVPLIARDAAFRHFERWCGLKLA